MDKNVLNVAEAMLRRAEIGLSKYGVTTERTDLTQAEWIQHAQEEAMDMAVYLERMKQDVDYDKVVQRTAKSMPTQEVDGQTLNVLHWSLGLSGEVGELVDTVKKNVFYGQQFDQDNALEELSDILYYTVAMANELGYTLSDLQEHTNKKLSKRYPNGYTDTDAKARKDKL